MRGQSFSLIWVLIFMLVVVVAWIGWMMIINPNVGDGYFVGFLKSVREFIQWVG